MEKEVNNSATFIDYLKNEQPHIWESISKAADEGLTVIDETNDAVTAANRLLLTYPDLHVVLNFLVDSWVKRKAEDLTAASTDLLCNVEKGNS